MTRLASFAVVALTAAGFSMPAFAQSNEGRASPWYVGVSLMGTYSRPPEDTVNLVDSALSAALGSAVTLRDHHDRFGGYKLFAGYGLNKYFAVEAGWADFGTSSVSYDFRTGLNSVGTFKMEYHMTAPFADAVVIFPIWDKLTLLARAGVTVGRTRLATEGQPLTLILAGDDERETSTQAHLGAGLQYAVTRTVAVRAEYERSKMPDPLSDKKLNLDTLSASFLFRF